MTDRVIALGDGTKLQILAPVVRDRKGEYRKELDQWRRQGFVRVRIDGELHDLAEEIRLRKGARHSIELVVDRDSVVVRRKKNGLTVKEEDLPRKEVEAVRVYDSGSRQNRAGHCMELLTATTTLHVVKWEVREGLPEFGEELAGRLGLDG